jgi:hypothetical protein
MVEINRNRGDQEASEEQQRRQKQKLDAPRRKESLSSREECSPHGVQWSKIGAKGSICEAWRRVRSALASEKLQTSRQASKRRRQECFRLHVQQAIEEMLTSRVSAGDGADGVETLQGIAAGESPVSRGFAVWKAQRDSARCASVLMKPPSRPSLTMEGIPSIDVEEVGMLFSPYAQEHWKTICHTVTRWLLHNVKRRFHAGVASRIKRVVFFAFLRSCVAHASRSPRCPLDQPGSCLPSFTRHLCQGDDHEQTD